MQKKKCIRQVPDTTQNIISIRHSIILNVWISDSKALPNIPANNTDKLTIHTWTKSKSQQKLTMVTLPTNENADYHLPPETMMYQ